jgi:site-specific DNA recombinase
VTSANAYEDYGYDDDHRLGRGFRGWRGLPCVIYIRISQADYRKARKAAREATPEARAEALAEQVKMHEAECLEFADDAGLTVVEVFREDYVSASRFRGAKRLPQRERMLAWIGEATGSVVVLTTELERIYRDCNESGAMIAEADRINDLAEARGAALHIVDTHGDTYDLSTPQGRYLFRVGVAVGERESDKTSDRRRRRERKRAKAGGNWGRRPFGYAKVFDADRDPTGALTIVDGTDPDGPKDTHGRCVDEAGLIRAAAARVIAEAAAHPERPPSLAAIAAEWAAAGVTTSYGGTWTGGELARLLKSPRYAPHPDAPERGIRVHRAGTISGKRDDHRKRTPVMSPGQWPPILDADTHERLAGRNGILRDPRRLGRTGGGGKPAKYTLTGGLARCGLCGTRMHAVPGANPPDTRNLACPSPPVGCSKVNRRMAPIEAYAREVVLWWLRDGGPYETYRAARRETGQADAGRARLAEIGREVDAKEAERAVWVERGRPGHGWADEDVRDALAVLRTERDTLRAEETSIRRRLTVTRAGAAPDLGVNWDAWPAEERREWLARYVDRVIVRPAGKGKRAFDPDTIDVIPGDWWAGTKSAHPGYPSPPAAVAGAAAPAPTVKITTPKLCGLPGCGEPHSAHGLCGMHAGRQRRAAAGGHPDDWDRSPAPLSRPYPGGRGYGGHSKRPKTRESRLRLVAHEQGMTLTKPRGKAGNAGYRLLWPSGAVRRAGLTLDQAEKILTPSPRRSRDNPARPRLA